MSAPTPTPTPALLPPPPAVATPSSERSPPSSSDILLRWLESKRRKGCVPATVHRYEREVVRVLLFLRSEGRPLDPVAWTLEDAARIKEFRHQNNWGLLILSDFARFAGSRVFEEAGIPPPVARHKVRWLTQDEAREVLESVQDDPLLSFVAMLGLGQGLRRVEWKRLRVEDVDLAQGRLLIRGKGRAAPKLAWSPLHPAFPGIFRRYLFYRERVVQEALASYPGSPVPPEALLVPSRVTHGLRPYTDTALDRLVRQIEAKVASRGRSIRLSSHMLRRSGATLLEEALLEGPRASHDGVYRTVQEFLRHENLATTMKYLESNPRRQKRAIDQFAQAFPWPTQP